MQNYKENVFNIHSNSAQGNKFGNFVLKKQRYPLNYSENKTFYFIFRTNYEHDHVNGCILESRSSLLSPRKHQDHNCEISYETP